MNKITVFFLAFFAAVSSSASDVILWRGETRSVILPDNYEPFKPPAGLVVKFGVIRPVRYRPERQISMVFQGSYDAVEWNAQNADGPRIAEISVPRNAKPGLYKWGGVFDNVKVIDRELPPPPQWKYYLDIWQHPWAVARYEKVKPFSKAHYDAMRPLWELLASAGQKVLTMTLVNMPWRHQCRDAYGTMVSCRKGSDGKLSFDYSIFDEYVEFGRSCGIGPYISCFSVCPWGWRVGWTDANGKKVVVRAPIGSKEFEAFWGPFLRSFSAHLKEKGWFDHTYLSMDEKPVEDVKLILDFVHANAPGMKIALAGNVKPGALAELAIDNYSQIGFFYPGSKFHAEMQERRKRGLVTTYYVCTAPKHPNTFLYSPVAENFWVGVYPGIVGLDGFLRWAWNSWPENPLVDASFSIWGAGDTFLVYPGARPSLRFLEMRNGIVAAEKLRILQESGEFKDLPGEIEKISKAFAASLSQPEKADYSKLKREVMKLVNR